MAIINGTAGNDLLVGTTDADTLSGLDGNDTLQSGGGADTISGGAGFDVIVTDLGGGQIDGGSGIDVVNVIGSGQVRLTLLAAAVGDDLALDTDGGLAVRAQRQDGAGVLTGPVTRIDDEGVVFFSPNGTFDIRDSGGARFGAAFNHAILGTGAADTFTAMTPGGVYYMNGGGGNDVLTGGALDDVLVGGAGDDLLAGLGGNNAHFGGAGRDRLTTELTGTDTFDTGEGVDQVFVERQTTQIRVTFRASGVGDGVGTDAADGGLAVRLQREDAAGALVGPVTRVDDEGVVIVASAAERGPPIDLRDLDGTLIGDDFEVVILGSTQDENLFSQRPERPHYFNGGQGADTFRAGFANDFLDGGAGDDVLVGGNGSDRYRGGAGADLIIGGTGVDIADGGSENDRVFGGAGDDLAFGGLGDDLLNGEGGADRLFGGAGADLMSGEDGADLLNGEGGDDALLGGAGDDVLSGEDGADLLFGASGADVMLGGAGTDLLNGEAGDDLLYGGEGRDVISGEAGADRIHGDAGGDELIGGAGADIFVYRAVGDSSLAGGVDIIADFVRLEDRIDLSAIDANVSAAGDQAFVFVGAFGNIAGQATLTFDAASNRTTFRGDVDGDGVADIVISVVGQVGQGDGFVL